jgi:hypothetical protein
MKTSIRIRTRRNRGEQAGGGAPYFFGSTWISVATFAFSC